MRLLGTLKCLRWLVAFLLLVPSCGGRSTANGGGGGSSGAAALCPSERGPKMVPIAAPLGTFCIDTTEVTQGQYQQFLDSSPPSQGGSCGWNSSFVPEGPLCNISPKTRSDYPIVCVDSCDASAYCAWAGKRLCGRIGGGAVTSETVLDGELHYACTNGEQTSYPYGSTFEPGACNDGGYGENTTKPVGSAPQCTGTVAPFDRVFDLLGNAVEWVDSGQGTACVSVGTPDTCDWLAISSCMGPGLNLGFRCCAEPAL